MIYDNIRKGYFIKRPNRFIAHIEIDGKEEICHVKNTGRMGELLIPGIPVYVQKSDNPSRKTAYSLISFDTESGIINVDSQVPNKIFYEANPLGFEVMLPEKTYGESRFDFYVERGGNTGYCEVKGVTLLGKENTAWFPDAPTERGIKHINHLVELKKNGRIACLAFIVKIPGIKQFAPNPADEKFVNALFEAKNKGVDIFAFGCSVTENRINIAEKIDVIL